jgi:TolA-binding protein
MKGDVFAGLGGLMKGLTGLMPQDDPEVKKMQAQSELNDLRTRETEIYAEIGKQALSRVRGQFPELESQLRTVQASIAEAQAKLDQVQAEAARKRQEEQVAKEQRTCPQCGHLNQEGVKFCQECGAKLGASKCNSCGATLAPGARFCGECGAKQ